jgi:tRNA A58 N-methylase Trm61
MNVFVGSGSLTHALATCIAPNGHVYSHEVEQIRVDAVREDIKVIQTNLMQM